jgi:hypothetical protein
LAAKRNAQRKQPQQEAKEVNIPDKVQYENKVCTG